MATYIRVLPNGTLDATCEDCGVYGPSGGRYDDASGQFFCSVCWKKSEGAAPAKKSAPEEQAKPEAEEGGELKKNRRPKTCVECGNRTTEVKQDEADGSWYCWTCWKAEAEAVLNPDSSAGEKKVNPTSKSTSDYVYDPHAHGHSTKDEKYEMLQFLRYNIICSLKGYRHHTLGLSRPKLALAPLRYCLDRFCRLSSEFRILHIHSYQSLTIKTLD
eukprot:1293470-Pyramimonas_sp.AAC.1